jgi:hypothetical protein
MREFMRALTPPLIWRLHRLLRRRAVAITLPRGRPEFESVDHYGNTSLFAFEVLRAHGLKPEETTLLSVGCKMAHLIDYLCVFRSVIHCTMVDTYIPVPLSQLPAHCEVIQGDFFDLSIRRFDFVLAQASLHCLSDTRYGNVFSERTIRRPYDAARKLRELIGSRAVPVVASVAVADAEHFHNDNVTLSHEKFVKSFEKHGFGLKAYFFDYYSGMWPQTPLAVTPELRRSKLFPSPSTSEWHYVIGNYHFA